MTLHNFEGIFAKAMGVYQDIINHFNVGDHEIRLLQKEIQENQVLYDKITGLQDLKAKYNELGTAADPASAQQIIDNDAKIAKMMNEYSMKQTYIDMKLETSSENNYMVKFIKILKENNISVK